MELATALIWTLRIVLPIILFWIYFKLQTPKDEYAGGPKTNCHTRAALLEHRKATLARGGPVPESMENLTLKGEAEAPALFASAPSRQPRGGGGGGRKPAGESAARRDRGERPEKREPREPREAPMEEPREEVAAAPQPSKASPAAAEPIVGGEESDKMHLESLLNYVAFSRKEQQRTFLIDGEAGAPPPPPPPPKKKAPAAAPPEQAATTTTKISTESSGKANAEAQMVLRGAMNFKRSDVAKELYDQLAGSDVEISEQTYTLMIEACILTKDLKHASDFLMKMEAKGFCPDMELLDKVMDLYSVQKGQREQEKQIAKAGGAAMKMLGPEDFAMGLAGMEGQWAPDAMMAGMQLPMGMSVEGVLEEKPKLSTAAAIFQPTLAEEEALDAQTPLEEVPQRSALSVRAKPFQPVHDVVFDPDTYTWTVNAMEGDGEAGENPNKGKGSGKKSKKGDGEAKGRPRDEQKGRGRGGGAKPEEKQEVSQKGASKKKEWTAKSTA